MYNSEYEYIQHKQISSITLHCLHLLLLHFVDRNHGSIYQLTLYRVLHIFMQVFWIYNKSAVKDTIIKLVPRFRKSHNHSYLYLFLVTGTFQSNTGVRDIRRKYVIPPLLFLMLNKTHFYNIMQVIFTVLTNICCKQ